MPATERVRIIDHAGFSREVQFRKRLDGFKTKYISLWQSAGTEVPVMRERFDPAVQAGNERETDRLVEHIDEQFRQVPDMPADRKIWRAHLRERIWKFGRDCFRFPDNYLSVVLSDAYFQVTSEFAREAETFDRNIDPEALSQAMRNVWVMNCLQMFLGRRVSLSPSIFAYSMLYPYTDNILDDARICRVSKQEKCRRLGLRLAGAAVEPAGMHERDVFRLVALIENEYARSEFPEVYEVLLAIHRGQVRSLAQQSSGRRPEEEGIINISVEKGGASVLADGYLITGRLNRAHAEFFFGIGVVLQLFDDLQDIEQDLQASRWTLFSENAHHVFLDLIASRLHSFLLSVLRSAPRFPNSAQRVLEDVIRRNCAFLLLQAVSQNQDLFSREYLRRLEPFSPVRFEYLKSLRAVIAQKHESLRQTVFPQRNLTSFYHLLA